MNKVACRAAYYLILSLIVSQAIDAYVLNAALLNALFTISGIMFAIGFGLIVNFLPIGVNNPDYIKRIKASINKVQRNFLYEFILVSVTYILSNLPFFSSIHVFYGVNVNFSIYFGVQIFASIFYFIYNFMEIKKLKDDIFDRLRGECQKH